MLQSLKLGNPKSAVAICTLWTPIELVARHLSEQDYAIIGQLYSKDAGINTLLRYCLANKNIRYIIVCGQDRVQSGEALFHLKQHGVDDSHAIIGVKGAAIDKEIPREAIELFRANIEIIDLRNTIEYSKLHGVIKSLPVKGSYGESETFPEAVIEIPKDFPTDPVFKIRAKTIGEAWLQALTLVMRFGIAKQSQHEEQQREMLFLVAAITDEDIDNIQWKPYFTFPKEELEQYIPQVITDAKIPELSYTYGQRLRSHKGIDQIASMAKKLIAVPYTRRAVACTWDIELDTDNNNPPCLNYVQALIQENKLYLLAYLRSNDIYGAWPKNAFALRKLQQQLCKETKTMIGDLIMISASAHIYERHFRQVGEILKEYGEKLVFDLPRSAGNLDPRGNIHIELKDEKIRVTHLGLDGTRLEQVDVQTAQAATKWLILHHKISDISHALYLGQELMKAEIALKKGLEYRQDGGLG